jgi:hypothetical protein
MRSIRLLILGFLATTAAAQQGLVCPTTAAAGRPCEAFHYHVGMYRPDSKQFVEIFGANPFATQAACDRAREAQMEANARVLTDLKGTGEQKYEPDRFGPCHCDMTIDRSSPNFLTDAQRVLQVRGAEEIRLRVREHLLDRGLTTDAGVVRGLWTELPVTPLAGSVKLVPMPQGAGAPLTTTPDDLKATKSIDTSKPTVAALDLPLMDITAPAAETPAEPAPGTAPATAVPPAPARAPTPAPAPATSAPEAPMETVDVPAPVETRSDPQPVRVVQAENVPTEEEVQSAQETAEHFVTYETQRIQSVLRASAAIGDESVKSKIFEACMQRIQLLSNLRLLIEGSGMRSRLAAAARQAESETARLALIARLFGEDIGPHWAPKDAADVVFEVGNELAAAPERALRDTTGTFSGQQKRKALYLVLARTQPTEDQRLWLSSVVEGFLQ